jgi:gliding motility-associated-like protein
MVETMKTKFYLPLLLFVWIVIEFGSINAQCPACQYNADLITNGSFIGGNSGFTSDLNYVTGIFCPLCPENTYTVGFNATFYHSDFTGSDHTNPPFGNFYIANGPGTAGVSVWCQTIQVQPQTDYTFSFWARDITNNSDVHPYALLQPSFNGVLIADTLVADGNWESFTMIWSSGAATSLDLCILNQQSLTGGNDFGLDDISLSACKNYSLSQSANAGPDVAVCSQIPIQIGQTQQTGYTYAWDNAVGLSSASASDPTLSIQNVSLVSYSETYILTTDSAGVGCVTKDTVTVTILPMPEFSLSNDTTICPGTTATLNAGDTWTDIVWSTSQTSSNIEVGEGNYSATVHFYDCSASDDVSVFLTDMPLLSLGPDTSFCATGMYELNPGMELIWNDGSYADSLLVAESGEYSATYTSGVCSISDTVTITMFLPPLIPLPADTSFCEGTVLTLDAQSVGLWNTGVTSASVEILNPGYYDVVIENGPCTVQSGTDVRMIQLPELKLFNDTSLCEDFELNVSVFSDRNTYYSWSTGDTSSSIYLHEPGIYEVIVGNACDTISSEFEIETYPCTWGIFVPTCFTPNDDDINEAWIVQGYNVTNVRIYVYNRLGDLIFYAPDIGLPWYPSLSVGDDVYNYTIYATAFDGAPVEQHGHVYLLR